MTLAKLQYEIRYNHLLEFKDVYRKIVQPYLRDEGVEFVVSNQNTLDEYITIKFLKLGFLVDLRWDRMFILIEGDNPNIRNSTSVMKYFFEIYDKLLKSTSLTVKLVIIAAYFVKPIEETEENIVEGFKRKYLSEKLKMLSSPSVVKDYLIQIVSKPNETSSCTINFGPFSKDDIKKHNLASLNVEPKYYLDDVVGEICHIQMNKKDTTISMTRFREAMDEITTIVNEILN